MELECHNILLETIKLVETCRPSLEESLETLLSDADIGLHDRRLVVTRVLGSVEHESSLSMLSLLVWERLNTGHWSQVWRGWRQLYGLISVARVRQVSRLATDHQTQVSSASELVRDLIKMCDMGLLLGGPDIMGGVLETLAQEMTEYLANICDNDGCDDEDERVIKKPKLSASSEYNVRDHSLKLTLPLEIIPELECPSIPEFVSRCKVPGEVTKLTGSMSDWPALRSWSAARLVRLAGPRTVPVEVGRRYTDHDWTQQLMTVEQFVDQYLSSESEAVGYLAQHQLLSQVPALQEDILTPDYCYTGDSDLEPEVNVWIGPGGTVSPAHTDKKHNVLCQVAGHKYVAVFSPDQDQCLYPDHSPMFSNTSQVDLDSPDYDQFPLLKQLRGQHTILAPGDMLYIPPLVWHYVRSLEQSFSVSFWWQ